jgi:hypothetical protein
MFELRSALRFIALADDEAAWARLSRIRSEQGRDPICGLF